MDARDPTDLRLRPAGDADAPGVRALVESVLHEFGLKPDPQGTDRDLAALEASYRQRGGEFLVLEDATGRLLGCAGLYPLDAERVELRKMYFIPALRGRGMGRALLQHLLARARALGFRRVELETASVLEDAMRLYEAAGFQRQMHAVQAARCDRAYALDLAGWQPPPAGPSVFRTLS